MIYSYNKSQRDALFLTSPADSQHNLYDKHILLCIQHWDSWWWTVSPSATCRVLYQNKFEKLVHLFGLYYRKTCLQVFKSIFPSSDWLNYWMTDWMNEGTDWMNEWTDWMNEWMNEWTDWLNEWMNEWLNDWTELMDWLNEWMNGPTDWTEWMNEWMNEWTDWITERLT